MFRDERQACAAIRSLLERLPALQQLWTDDGPAERAVELLENGGGPLSHGEAIMLRVAFDLWNGHGGATLADTLVVLDRENAEAVLTLVLAVQRGGVDAWLACRGLLRRGAR